MSASGKAWACWREPGEDQAYCVTAPPRALEDASALGFVVHPFQGEGGCFIPGIRSMLPVQPPDDWVLHPGAAYPEDEREDYIRRLQTLLAALARGEVEKVVFSRRKHLRRTSFSISEAWEAFHRVAAAYPQAFISLVSVPGVGCWLAATPEVLCRSQSEGYYTMALAGTRSLNDPEPWHAKEYREQALVTDSIREQLSSAGVNEIRIEGPKEVEAGLLRHLRSDFYFNGGPGLLGIARALHPTPAVGGLPRAAASSLIEALELSPRGLYAGYVGYVDEERPSALYVYLRCACLSAAEPTLFAGGGILADSDPEAEWLETEHKLQVLLTHLA